MTRCFPSLGRAWLAKLNVLMDHSPLLCTIPIPAQSLPSSLLMFPSPSHPHFLVFPPSLFSPMFSRGGGGGGGGAQLNKANKKIDDLQHKVMQKTEELMEMHKRQTESAEKIASLTAQLRSKEEECTKKDAK